MSEFFKEQVEANCIKSVQENKEQKEKDIELLSKEEEKINDENIDLKYIPIALSTNGVFDFPKKVYIRDFDIEELIDISSAVKDEQRFYTIKALNGILKNQKDAMKLLETEAKEIILSLIANNYTTELPGYSYILDKEEEKILKENDKLLYKNYKDGTYTFEITIPIKDIKKIPIPEEFKEPITLRDKKGFELKFKLPRMGDILVVNKFLKKKYKEKEEKYFKLSQQYQKDNKNFEDNISLELKEELEEYINQKAKDYLVYTAKMMLISIGKKKLNSIDEKIKQHIRPIFYERISEYIKNSPFGIQNEVEIISPITGKKVTRRFQFRPYKLLLFCNSEDRNSEVDISFG